RERADHDRAEGQAPLRSRRRRHGRRHRRNHPARSLGGARGRSPRGRDRPRRVRAGARRLGRRNRRLLPASAGGKTVSLGRVMPFELQPTLTGELVALRPLRPDDWDALYGVASDPLIWEQHPNSDRYKPEVFREFFRDALAGGGAFLISDAKTGEPIGSSRYHGYDETKREIEIGWTFLARSRWGGDYNRDLKRLMLAHAFRFVDRVIFVIGPTNWRSRRAIEQIGGVLDASPLDASRG